MIDAAQTHTSTLIRTILATVVLLLTVLVPSWVGAEDSTSPSDADPNEAKKAPPPLPEREGLIAPGQVDNLIAIDASTRMAEKRFGFLDPYDEWKLRLRDRTGFGFGVDYTAVGFAANETLGDYAAAGGIARIFASWKAIRTKRFTGGLVFRGDHRHKYTSLAPVFFGTEIGYVGVFELPFNDAGFFLHSLYWRQRFLSDRLYLFAGHMDAAELVDVYPLGAPFLHFMNLAFQIGSGTILSPRPGLGFALGARITKNIYVVGSIYDRNANPTQPGKTFRRFFTERQYFKSIELGWSEGGRGDYLYDVHVTFWHADASFEIDVPSGWGLAASATYKHEDRIIPFVRGGYSREAGTLLQGSVSTGVGFMPVKGQDLLGFAFNWGRPNPDTFGSGLRDQYTFELFYRLQVANQLAITPDLQLIVHPALNPDVPVTWVFGLRMRLSL